jgi:hypothetical protein
MRGQKLSGIFEVAPRARFHGFGTAEAVEYGAEVDTACEFFAGVHYSK